MDIVLNVGMFVILLPQFTHQRDEGVHELNVTIHPSREIRVNATDKIILLCHVNASLLYCRFTNPTEEEVSLSPDQPGHRIRYHGKGLVQGDCGLEIIDVRVVDRGSWTCGLGFSDRTLEVQENFTVEVIDPPQPPEQYYIDGDDVVVDCSDPVGEHLEYCRVVLPNGTGLHLVPGVSVDHYSYWGDGLDKGHCRLRIKSINFQDFGMWLCAAKVRGGNWEYIFPVHLKPIAVPIFGLGLGGISGLVIAIGLIMFFVVCEIRDCVKKRTLVLKAQEKKVAEIFNIPTIMIHHDVS